MSTPTEEERVPPDSRQGISSEEGTAAERRVASLQNPVLFFDAKAKILDLLKVFADHGYVSLEDVAVALDRTSELVSPKELEALRARVGRLETELEWERASRAMIESDFEESERVLASERELVKESLARIASLEQKLKDARRTTVKLIAASRSSLESLKRVRSELVTQTFAHEALNPLVHDLHEMAQTVQELSTLAVVKSATESIGPGNL